MSEYFDIIWRNSGLEASVQSMQRVAPCASVKADGPGVVFLVFDRLAYLELELIGELDQLRMQRGELLRNLVAVLRGEVGAVRKLGARPASR